MKKKCRIIQKIQNLFYYFNVIWNDLPTGSDSYFYLLKKKIERHRKFYFEHKELKNRNLMLVYLKASIILVDKILTESDLSSRKIFTQKLLKLLNNILLKR